MSDESYGSWPTDWKTIYGTSQFNGAIGLSLMQTRHIWYDIQRNYWR